MNETLYLYQESNPIMYESFYNDMITEKIYQEKSLISEINKILVLSESSTLNDKVNNLQSIYEARIQDTVKVRWKQFIDFIKGLIPKFMEAITKLVSNNKTYIDKYKQYIEKPGKSTMDVEFVGDYNVGIKRMQNTLIPIFSYNNHAEKLKSDGDKDIAEMIVGGEFKYKDGEPLAKQLKDYFLGVDKGKRKEKFSSINMKELSNFCYNADNIKTQFNKDMSHLEASTNSIQGAINRELQNTNESTFYLEADDNNASNQNNAGKDDGANPNSGVKITDSNPVEKSKSYDNYNDPNKDELDKNAKDAKDADENIKGINDMVKKWIEVCRLIITSKMNAQQQINKDYMSIIRAHVRSYLGNKEKSDDNKKDNNADNKSNDNKQENSNDNKENNKQNENK